MKKKHKKTIKILCMKAKVYLFDYYKNVSFAADTNDYKCIFVNILL